jgi:hypothetical protein
MWGRRKRRGKVIDIAITTFYTPFSSGTDKNRLGSDKWKVLMYF